MEHFTSTGSPKISATKINVQGLKLYVYAYTFERNIVFWKVVQYGAEKQWISHANIFLLKSLYWFH